MTRIFSVLAIASFCLLLVGCGGDTATHATDNVAPQTDPVGDTYNYAQVLQCNSKGQQCPPALQRLKFVAAVPPGTWAISGNHKGKENGKPFTLPKGLIGQYGNCDVLIAAKSGVTDSNKAQAADTAVKGTKGKAGNQVYTRDLTIKGEHLYASSTFIPIAHTKVYLQVFFLATIRPNVQKVLAAENAGKSTKGICTTAEAQQLAKQTKQQLVDVAQSAQVKSS